MKKLIIGVLVVAAAVAANAATVTWSMTAVKTVDGSAAAPLGWVAGFFADDLSGSLLASTKTGLESGSINVKDLMGSATYTASTTALGTTTRVNSAGNGNYAIGESAIGFMILLDSSAADAATHYLITGIKSATVAATGANITLGYGVQSNYSWNEIAPVPEPTSGLLLLLGMAGLALKRKQA